MLLPEDPSTCHIMVATGTGIAPFRSYVRRFFCEDVPNYNFKGLAWLFMGVANSDAKLYDDEFQALLARYPDQFRLDYALSREQNNRKGGKMYIQDKVEEYKDQVFDLMNNGAHMYFCGLKGMMPGILDMLEGVCKEKGLNFEEWLEGLKHKVRASGQDCGAAVCARASATLRGPGGHARRCCAAARCTQASMRAAGCCAASDLGAFVPGDGRKTLQTSWIALTLAPACPRCLPACSRCAPTGSVARRSLLDISSSCSGAG
jgi:hypothetical protein